MKFFSQDLIIMDFVVLQMTDIALIFLNRQQYLSINGYDLGLTKINRGVCSSRICSRTLTFFCYNINDLNQDTKFCDVHHFADDNNLVYLSKSIKKPNKPVNSDLKSLVNWLNAN